MKTDKLEISDIRISYPDKVESLILDSNIKAFASFEINNVFCINGIKIISDENGIYASFPKYNSYDGNIWHSIESIDRDFHNLLQHEIINHYILSHSYE